MPETFGNHKHCQEESLGEFFYTKIVLISKKLVTNKFKWQKILVTFTNLVAKPNYDKQICLTQHFL